MAHDAASHEDRGRGADGAEELAETLAGLDLAAIEDLLGGMLAGAPFEPPEPPSQRRPRRDDVVTYRVRVDLEGPKPPLWRRLELASDLFLDDVHEILQVAFGWTDSHLHRFSSGPGPYHHETEHYLSAFEVAQGEPGVAETEVRLDEVLAAVGDRLFYTYDFGDDWQHTVQLEAVLPRAGAVPRAVCTTGRRAGPPEDCGGVHGYEMVAAAADPDRPHHAELAEEFVHLYGDDVDPALLGTPFDRDETNRALAELGSDGAEAAGDLPGPLAALLDRVRVAAQRRRLQGLLADARLDETVSPDADTAARMMRPYTWLLERVGAEGIRLTGAGYLPPAHVEAAVDALGLAEEWIGKGNREVQTLPVLHLRETAQAFGLLRKYRGRLLLTARGDALRTDPVRLWWHVAERMPPRSTDPCEAQAGLLLLVAVAAQSSGDRDELVADLLDALGWQSRDGSWLTSSMAARAAWDTSTVLRRVGALTAGRGGSGPARPTPEGVAFARAALQVWPDSHPPG